MCLSKSYKYLKKNVYHLDKHIWQHSVFDFIWSSDFFFLLMRKEFLLCRFSKMATVIMQGTRIKFCFDNGITATKTFEMSLTAVKKAAV